MEIVSFKTQDAAKVAEFFREIFAENGWAERENDFMEHPELLFHLPDGGMLILIKTDGQVIGTAGLIKMNRHKGLVKRFYLKKAFRGTGVAKQLLDELISKSKNFGITELILDVSKNNIPAIKFYQKHGFVPTTVEPQPNWPESNAPDSHFYFKKSSI